MIHTFRRASIKTKCTRGRLLLLGLLNLLSASLLGAVLALLTLLAAHSGLRQELLALKSVFRLEALGGDEVIVDESEAGAASTSEDALEAEDEDGGGILDVVHLGENLLELSLGDGSTSGVRDLENLRTHHIHHDGRKGSVVSNKDISQDR